MSSHSPTPLKACNGVKTRTRSARTHDGTTILVMAIVLMLSACVPVMPGGSSEMFDQAQRMAATETGRVIQATVAARQTEAAHVQATRAAVQATYQAATAVMLRGTEISAEATALAIQDDANQRHAQASVTAAWLNGQLTVIPVYLGATATRRAEVAQRADRAEDAAGWALLALVGIAVLALAGQAAGDVLIAWKRALEPVKSEETKEEVISVADLPVDQWQAPEGSVEAQKGTTE